MPFSSNAFLIIAKACAADDELLARQGHHLIADLDGVIAEGVDALHLQRLEDQRRVFRILGQIQADLLDQLSGALSRSLS